MSVLQGSKHYSNNCFLFLRELHACHYEIAVTFSHVLQRWWSPLPLFTSPWCKATYAKRSQSRLKTAGSKAMGHSLGRSGKSCMTFSLQRTTSTMQSLCRSIKQASCMHRWLALCQCHASEHTCGPYLVLNVNYCYHPGAMHVRLTVGGAGMTCTGSSCITKQASDDRSTHTPVILPMQCSADMLEDIKVPWVILGHSERRSLLKESEEVRIHLSTLCRLSQCICHWTGFLHLAFAERLPLSDPRTVNHDPNIPWCCQDLLPSLTCTQSPSSASRLSIT